MVLKAAMISAVLLMLAVCIAPVSAVDFADNNQTYIEMANGAFYEPYPNNTYYFNFSKSGGGLKAIHITDSTTDLDGDVYTNKSHSGNFYISDTSKDPGCSDSAIVMFGVPGVANTTNLELNIVASGYNWTPLPTIAYPQSVTYYDSVNIGTFDNSHFLENDNADINCTWRPYFDDNYPMYYGQNMANSSDKYNVMFIDLGLGTLNATISNSTLTDNGMINVSYTITGYDGDALFDIYTWCNQSKQGKSVSWTNRVIDTKSSGWIIDF